MHFVKRKMSQQSQHHHKGEMAWCDIIAPLLVGWLWRVCIMSSGTKPTNLRKLHVSILLTHCAIKEQRLAKCGSLFVKSKKDQPKWRRDATSAHLT